MRQAAVSKDLWGVSSYVSVAAWVLWTCGSRPELLPSLSLDMSRALFSGLEVRFLMVSVVWNSKEAPCDSELSFARPCMREATHVHRKQGAVYSGSSLVFVCTATRYAARVEERMWAGGSLHS